MVDATSGALWEIDLFWFMLIALVAVVAAVAMAVLGDGGALKDSDPDRIDDRLPADRPLIRGDIDAVRLPVAVRGYRMLDVDEVLDRLGAELAERDARIAELETSLAGVRAHGATRAEDGPGQGVQAQGQAHLLGHPLDMPSDRPLDGSDRPPAGSLEEDREQGHADGGAGE